MSHGRMARMRLDVIICSLEVILRFICPSNYILLVKKCHCCIIWCKNIWGLGDEIGCRSVLIHNNRTIHSEK